MNNSVPGKPPYFRRDSRITPGATLHIRFTTHQPRPQTTTPTTITNSPSSFPSSAGSSQPALRAGRAPIQIQVPFCRNRGSLPSPVGVLAVPVPPVTGVDWRSIQGWIRSLFVWLGSPRLLRRIDRFAQQSIISAANPEISCIQFVADLLAVWWRAELKPVQFRNSFGCST